MTLAGDHEPKAGNSFLDTLHGSFEQIGISPDDCVIAGGKVLEAHGIRAAHDLDILVGPQTFTDMLQKSRSEKSDITINTSRKRPGVLSVDWDKGPHYGSGHIDVICEYDPTSGIPLNVAQDIFRREQIDRSDTVDGLHFFPLEQAVDRIRTHPHHKVNGYSKSEIDIQIIRQYLREIQAGNAPISAIGLGVEEASRIQESLNKSWRHKVVSKLRRIL